MVPHLLTLSSLPVLILAMVYGRWNRPSFVYVVQRGYGKDAKDTDYTSLPKLIEGEKLEGVFTKVYLSRMLRTKVNGKAHPLSTGITITRFSYTGVRLLYG
jgi:hypothetical protein